MSQQPAALPSEMRAPFDLASDMLFVGAMVPTAPLRDSFPGIPFVSLMWRTPLIIWFSTVTEGCYRDGQGQRHCLGGPQECLYNEVTFMAVLRKRTLFCPAIYATSDLSIQIARGYGMPKTRGAVDVSIDGDSFKSQMQNGAQRSFVLARPSHRSSFLGSLIRHLWPVWTWPVRFPSGSRVQALVVDTPRIQINRVSEGKLALDVPWLRRPASFLRWAMFIPQLRMQLPPPGELSAN